MQASLRGCGEDRVCSREARQQAVYSSSYHIIHAPIMPALHEDTSYALQVRDVGTDLAPNPTQRTTLIIAGVYVVVIAILWFV